MANPNFEPHSPLAAIKLQWRRELRRVRRQIGLERRKEASYQACRWIEEEIKSQGHILSFASFGFEIDLWPLNHQLALEGRLVLPRLIEGNISLFQVTQINHLEKHPWGHLEPNLQYDVMIPISQIEVALIPGLGFDLNTKHRLGYGQGYYDMLLTSTLLLTTWGVGYKEQSVENLPYEKHDIPLKQIYLF